MLSLCHRQFLLLLAMALRARSEDCDGDSDSDSDSDDDDSSTSSSTRSSHSCTHTFHNSPTHTSTGSFIPSSIDSASIGSTSSTQSVLTSKKPNGAWKGGLAFAIVALVMVILVTLWFIRKRRRQLQRVRQEESLPVETRDTSSAPTSMVERNRQTIGARSSEDRGIQATASLIGGHHRGSSRQVRMWEAVAAALNHHHGARSDSVDYLNLSPSSYTYQRARDATESTRRASMESGMFEIPPALPPKNTDELLIIRALATGDASASSDGDLLSAMRDSQKVLELEQRQLEVDAEQRNSLLSTHAVPPPMYRR